MPLNVGRAVARTAPALGEVRQSDRLAMPWLVSGYCDVTPLEPALFELAVQERLSA